MNLCQIENRKVFSVSKSSLWYCVVRDEETRCESVFVLAVWWMRWTSPQWSWMKHSGNFRPTSVSKEKPRKWSGSLKLLGRMWKKSLRNLSQSAELGGLGLIQVTFLIIFSVLTSYKHFQMFLVWGWVAKYGTGSFICWCCSCVAFVLIELSLKFFLASVEKILKDFWTSLRIYLDLVVYMSGIISPCTF